MKTSAPRACSEVFPHLVRRKSVGTCPSRPANDCYRQRNTRRDDGNSTQRVCAPSRRRSGCWLLRLSGDGAMSDCREIDESAMPSDFGPGCPMNASPVAVAHAWIDAANRVDGRMTLSLPEAGNWYAGMPSDPGCRHFRLRRCNGGKQLRPEVCRLHQDVC